MTWNPGFKGKGISQWNPEYAGQTTPKPVEFAPGFNVGPPGPQGAPGISPKVEIEPLDNGHRVKIEAANGSFFFDLFDGAAGKDGISPAVSVSSIDNGHRVTISDARGTYSFDLYNGARGETGAPGTDGVSPSVGVVQTADGHRVSITDASGTTSFDLLNGKDGAAGSPGEDGKDGEPGKPPAVGGDGNWQVWDGEKYVDTGYSATALHNNNGGGLVKMWFGSIEEYNALDTIYNDVAYHILEGAIPV